MSDPFAMADMFTAQLDRLFAARLDRAMLRAAEDGVWPASLWDECEAMGLPLLLVPESLGGSGFDWSTASTLFKLLGKHSIPLPIGETIIAARLLADAGLEPPSGALTFAVVGELDAVPWAGQARYLVLLRPGKIDLATVGASSLTAGHNIGRDPRDEIRLEEARVIASGTLATAGPDLAMKLGAMLRSCQMAGALDAITSMTVDYANTRVQFGRAIGKFQAVQQSLAVLACEAAAADVAASMAAHALDQGAEGEFDIALAKIRTGEAAGIGAASSHQIHGAIGFTDEHRLHDFTRRLWSWRSEFGSERYWAARLGRIAAKAESGLWDLITARPGETNE